MHIFFSDLFSRTAAAMCRKRSAGQAPASKIKRTNAAHESPRAHPLSNSVQGRLNQTMRHSEPRTNQRVSSLLRNGCDHRRRGFGCSRQKGQLQLETATHALEPKKLRKKFCKYIFVLLSYYVLFSSHRSGGHMKATQRPLNGHSMATQWPLHFYGVFCDPNITKQSDLYKV